MAEVTRVPIQPIAQGSLTKLWLGVFIAILVGAGIAWAAVPKSLKVETLVEGEGEFAQEGDLAFVKYTGTLADTGVEFDKWRPEQLPIPGIFPEGTAFEIQKGAVVDGFFEGLQQMKKGRQI
ncbi:MAG: FKBP-type peptidyl-prolyl cis-trans isomerase [Pseudomonadota bacterium]